MLSGQLLRSGNLRDFTALGGVGYPVYAAAAQIRTAVAKQLGQEYADFLAIPQFDSKGESIDWYAAIDGDIVPWQAASEVERSFMRQRLTEICAKIEDHARQIQAAPRSNDQLVFGRLLELCTRIPDDSHIYLIGGKPLITFWGFVRAGADTTKHVLSDLPAPPPAAPIQPATVAPVLEEPTRRRSWWMWLLWLLLLLLLLALLLFGLRSCAVLQPVVPMLPDFLQGIIQEDKPAPVVIGPDGKVVPGGTVIGPDGTVTVPGTVVPGTAVPGETGTGTTDGTVPVTPDQGADDKSADGKGADDKGKTDQGAEKTPDVTDKDQNNQSPDQKAPDQQDQKNQPPQPKLGDQGADDQKKPDDQKTGDQKPGDQNPADQKPADQAARPDTTPPIKPIDIPDQASSKGDTSFMEGDWRSKTGLVAKNAKGPVTIDYNFDKTGKGTTTLRMQDGVTCSGPSMANTSSGHLTVQDQGQLSCSNGQSFAGSKVDCVKDAAGQTKCTGHYPNGQTYEIMLGR